MEDLEKYLKALLLLKLDGLNEGDTKPKPDVLLVSAGFTAKEAAELTDRSEAAVRKAVSRARAAKDGE